MTSVVTLTDGKKIQAEALLSTQLICFTNIIINEKNYIKYL